MAEKTRTTREEIKIAQREEIAEITAWSLDVEGKIAAADEDIAYLSNCLHEVEQLEIDKTRKQQIEFERELLE